MYKRIMSWGLAVALTVGSLMPSTNVYAAEDAEMALEVTQDELLPEAIEGDNDGSAEENVIEADNQGAEEAKEPEGDPAEVSGSEEEQEPEAEPEESSQEPEIQNEAEAQDATEAQADLELNTNEAQGDSSFDGETDPELTLTVRNIDLMYGETPDNADGHLDRLFAPVITGGEVAYELKSDKSKEDANTFVTSYRFYTDKDDEASGISLDKAQAGSRLYAVAEAFTSDGRKASAEFEVSIVKRPLSLSFPTSDEISVSPEDYPEDGLLVVPSDSELISETAVEPLSEYSVTEADEEITVTGTKPDDIQGVPCAADIIAGEVTVDVSALDLLTEGFQPAPASFEISEEVLENYTVSLDNDWPVLVLAGPEEPTMTLMALTESKVTTALGAEDKAISENRIGFVSYIDPASKSQNTITGVAVESTRAGIRVEIYASKKANRSGAVLIGTLDTVNEYFGNASDDNLKQYHLSNTVPVSFDSLAQGTWYIFGRFYTNEGTKGYVECTENIVLNNKLPAPKALKVTGASAKEIADGAIIFEKPEGAYTLSYGLYGEKDMTQAPVEAEGFVVNNLKPGRYVAVIRNDATFASSLSPDSDPADFYIEVEKPQPEDIELTYYSTGKLISENETVEIAKGETKRVVGTVMPLEVGDTGVTYVSSNPKAVSVDAQGNLKGVAKTGEVEITVATAAKGENGEPLVKKTFKVQVVEVTPLKVKSAKFEKSTVTADYNDGSVKLTLLFDKTISQADAVSWMVDNRTVATVSEDTTDAFEGVSENTLEFKGPGKVIVTASIGGVKAVTCTVNIEGSKGETEPYYYKGKFVTGFAAISDENGKIVATGNAAFKAKLSKVKYYDASGYPVSGIYKVGNKLYYFDKDCDLLRGETDKDERSIRESTYKVITLVINKQGELQTGWQTPDEETVACYYSPVDGCLVESSWVPKGKGYTWVNERGHNVDADNRWLTDDGVHWINGSRYFFKGGICQTGFAYFDGEGNLTTAKKASTAGYFQAPTGEMLTGQFFWVGGKNYYAFPNDGHIVLNGIFKDSKNKQHYADANGAMVFGPKIINIKDDGSYYIDADGIIATGRYVTLGGKIYDCGSDGRIRGAGEGSQTSYYCYLDQDGDGTAEKTLLYSKLVNPNNAAAGAFFYRDAACTGKVTNTWIYYSRYPEPGNLYLDKNGNPVSGFVKIDGSTYFFNPDNGYECNRHAESEYIVSYKGNNYICNPDGTLYNTTGEFKCVDGDYYRVKNSSGVLMTGIQTIQTTEYGKQKYVFSPEGRLYSPRYASFIPYTSEKWYYFNPEMTNDPKSWYMYVPGKVVFNGRGAINKDGSEFLCGWITYEGNKYYIFDGCILYDEREIVKIGGKYYNFDEDGIMQTGWKKISNPYVHDLTGYTRIKYTGDFYFYFNAKTGAMETGWKTMNTLKTDALGNVSVVNGEYESGPKKKIYFNTATVSGRPIGALARNTDLTVSGKLYRFGADGGVESGKEGFVYSSPDASQSDGAEAYRKADGTMARGRTLVKTASGNYYYYFNPGDGRKETNVIRKTGNKWYFYGANGAMATNLSGTAQALGKTVVANFNADGSIKNFVALGTTTVVKNDSIELSGKIICVIGNNGLPATGVVKLAADGRTVFVDTDGRCDITGADGELKLRKVGSKYYMTLGGEVLNIKDAEKYIATQRVIPDGTGMFMVFATDDMFTELPAADQKEVQKCLRYNKTFGDNTSAHDLPYTGSLLLMMVGGDGSVRAMDYKTKVGTLTTNKYGIAKDCLSIFVKQGSWRISSLIDDWEKGYRVFKAMRIEYAMEDKIVIGPDGLYDSSLRINWDANGKILSILDNSTGKNANGDFAISYGGEVVMISVRNGKVSTGTVKIKTLSSVASLVIDKEYGIGIDSEWVND